MTQRARLPPPLSSSSATRRRLLRLLAATPLLGACGGTTVLNQMGLQPVPPDGLPRELAAPVLQVGDEWRYVKRSALTGLTIDRVRVQVTAAEPDGYAVAEDWQTAGPITARFDRNLNPLRSGDWMYEPAYPRFSFPLALGKTWSGEVKSSEMPARRYGTLRQRLKAKVRGWERVTVVAGTFTALRIDLAINWSDTDNAQVWGSSAETFWYAVEVRNLVLHHRVDYPYDGIQSSNVLVELESFRVGA
jgi:hypothetical protein